MTLEPIKGFVITHAHEEGEPCFTGINGCLYRRTLRGQIADRWRCFWLPVIAADLELRRSQTVHLNTKDAR